MTDLARRIATVLVYRHWCSDRRQTHLSVISKDRKQPPPFAYHWQYKNMFGCNWPRRQREQAIAWAEVALNGGFVVFYGIPKSGGSGGGSGLEHGLSPVEEDEAERWLSSHEQYP